MKHIVLTGFMGVGKTTLGKQLSAYFNIPFYDIDDEIIKGERQSIQALIIDSESYFRALENAYICSAIESQKPSIIALGGGAYCQPITYKHIKKANVLTVYLSMSDSECTNRLDIIKSSRPLLNQMTGDQWKQQALDLYQKRRPLYERADMIIDIENLTLENFIQRIEECYGKIF